MVSLKIPDVKSFMNALLIQNIFDNFLLSELDIITFNHFHITGNINKDFYSTEEAENLGNRKYSLWSEVKPVAFSLVKGNKLPLSIKIIFLLSPSNVEQVLKKSGISMSPEDINGLFLNIRFEKGTLNLITGTSVRIFTLDKTLETVWDANMKAFLKHYEIIWEDC